MTLKTAIEIGKPFRHKDWRYLYIYANPPRSSDSNLVPFLKCIDSDRADIYQIYVEEAISNDFTHETSEF